MKHLETGFLGKNSFGRYLGMTLIILVGVANIGAIPLAVVLIVNRLKNGGIEAISSANMMDFSQFGISNNLGVFLMLLSFVACFFAFWGLIKPMHGRTLLQTINGGRKMRWHHFGIGALVWGIITVSTTLFSYITAPEDFTVQFDAGKFAVLLLIVLTILPLQTSFEEIFFRGYLAQGFAKASKNRWVVLVVVSVLFGLLHSANPEVKEYGFALAMPQYVIMGLMLGIVAILDDGIETAMGIHFANNALSALLVTDRASALQTDAILYVNNPQVSYTDLITVAATGVIAVLILWRVFKWDFSIMNKRIEPNTPPIPLWEA